MLTRKTQYGWMALGGMICLFGLILACKIRDGNRANAEPEPPTPVKKEKESSPSIFTLPPTLATIEPTTAPPAKSGKTPEPPRDEKSSHPKATLETPMPSEPPFPPGITVTAPPAPSSPLPPLTGAAQTPPLPLPSPVLPTAYDPNKPPPPDELTSAPPPPPASKPAALSSPQTKMPDVGTAKSVPVGINERNIDTHAVGRTSAPDVPGIVAPTITPPVADHDSIKAQPGEPPLAPAPGPVQLYHVRGKETLHDIARRTLGSGERWTDLHKLNPTLKPDEPLASGTTVRLPADACLQADDADPVKPLPIVHSKPPAPKAKVLPLTGTYQCSLDEKGQLTLPRAIRDQLSGSDTVLLSPGPDKCLWLTNHPHLERLSERLDQSQACEIDVRIFKRLYFAQTEKLTVSNDGRVTVPERLGQFAGLHQEVVLVGIDDHFEVWDAAHWRTYTQQKSAGHSATIAEQE